MAIPEYNQSSSQPLQLIRQYRSLPVPEQKLYSLGIKLFSLERLSLRQKVTVVFCSDYMIRKLNARYRKINKATDVLSFSVGDKDLLGEIYISLQRTAVQARRYHSTYEDEIIRLFIHGFYHLRGYDHITEKERLRMERKERNGLTIG